MTKISIAELETRVAARDRHRFVRTVAASLVPIVAAALFLWFTLQEIGDAQRALALTSFELSEAASQLADRQAEIEALSTQGVSLKKTIEQKKGELAYVLAQLCSARSWCEARTSDL